MLEQELNRRARRKLCESGSNLTNLTNNTNNTNNAGKLRAEGLVPEHSDFTGKGLKNTNSSDAVSSDSADHYPPSYGKEADSDTGTGDGAGGGLTLLRLRAWMAEPLERMFLMARLVDAAGPLQVSLTLRLMSNGLFIALYCWCLM